VIDVSDPAAPRRLGGFDTSGYAYGVQVVGTRAYVADWYGLQVIDVSDLRTPRSVGRLNIPGGAEDSRVVGDRVYVAAGSWGVQVFNLSETRQTQSLTFTLPATVAITNPPIRLAGAASSGLPVTYRVTSGPGRVDGNLLTVVGVGPVQVQAEQTGNDQFLSASLTAFTRVTPLSEAIYWSSLVSDEPLVWGRPYPLKATTRSGLPVSFRLLEGPAVISEGRITVTNSGMVTLVAETLGDLSYLPTSLTRSWNRPISGEFLGRIAGTVGGIQVMGTLAYVADGGAGLQVIDVSDAAAPRRLGGFDTSGYAYGVQVVGTLAYVADGGAGLQVIDVSDPAAPRRLGGFDTSGEARGLQIVGNLAYVADSYSGLQVIDVSDPAAPRRLGGFDTSGFASGVQVVGNLAYVADGSGGLQFLDVRNPTAPVRRGGYANGYSAYGLQVVGTLAYVADGSYGLQVIDVSNPAAPKRLGGFDTSGRAVGVQVVSGLAYVADDSDGLQVIDVRDPALPKLYGGFFDTAAVGCVFVLDQRAYLGGSAGLRIIRLFDDRPPGLSQRLTFSPPSAVNLTNSPVTLTATVPSGLPVTFRVVSGPATVTGALLTLTGEGRVVVRAEQAGDAQFLTAPAVQREITVLPAPTPLRVSEVSIVSGGRLRFRLDGPAAKSAVLQFSPDLKAWIAVSTNTVPVTLEPPMVSDSAAGFYRAVLQ
jgi:hypothetical protein